MSVLDFQVKNVKICIYDSVFAQVRVQKLYVVDGDEKTKKKYRIPMSLKMMEKLNT